MPTILDIINASRNISETARDAIAAALVAGANITITPNDGADTIIIAAGDSGVPDGDYGDIVVAPEGWSIDTGVVTTDMMAAIAASSILGNNTGGSAGPTALTAAQVKTLLAITTADISDFGGRVLLATATASSSATLDITSGLSSTYDVYTVEFDFKVDAVSQLALKMSTDGGSSWGASEYGYAAHLVATTGSSAVLTAPGTSTFIALTPSGAIGTGSYDNVAGSITLYRPAATDRYKRCNFSTSCNTGSTGYNCQGEGSRNTADAVNALQFVLSAGNLVSGNARLYGHKK